MTDCGCICSIQEQPAYPVITLERSGKNLLPVSPGRDPLLKVSSSSTPLLSHHNPLMWMTFLGWCHLIPQLTPERIHANKTTNLIKWLLIKWLAQSLKSWFQRRYITSSHLASHRSLIIWRLPQIVRINRTVLLA